MNPACPLIQIDLLELYSALNGEKIPVSKTTGLNYNNCYPRISEHFHTRISVKVVSYPRQNTFRKVSIYEDINGKFERVGFDAKFQAQWLDSYKLGNVFILKSTNFSYSYCYLRKMTPLGRYYNTVACFPCQNNPRKVSLHDNKFT